MGTRVREEHAMIPIALRGEPWPDGLSQFLLRPPARPACVCSTARHGQFGVICWETLGAGPNPSIRHHLGAAARAVGGAWRKWAAGALFYMQSLVSGTVAVQAFDGFLHFKGVVEKHQVSTVSAPAVVPCGASRRH